MRDRGSQLGDLKLLLVDLPKIQYARDNKGQPLLHKC